jgi:hypothetical protein
MKNNLTEFKNKFTIFCFFLCMLSSCFPKPTDEYIIEVKDCITCTIIYNEKPVAFNSSTVASIVTYKFETNIGERGYVIVNSPFFNKSKLKLTFNGVVIINNENIIIDKDVTVHINGTASEIIYK